jgi:hypothetical protein
MMPGEAMAATLPEDPMRDTLAAVQQNLATLDEADNAEDMINAIRGNELPLEARYAELAELVGPEDAKQTPESVLALVQPTILMSLDEGIGALAQEEMDVPVEGPMAQGIMSTVAPPADPGPPMPMPMGAPPANFNQGGLVRRGDNQPVQYFQDANPRRVKSCTAFSISGDNHTIAANYRSAGRGSARGQKYSATTGTGRRFGGTASG